MRKITKAIALLMFCCFSMQLSAQIFNEFMDSVVQLSSYDTVTENLVSFENLGIKEPGTEALDNTADWIIEKHLQYGYEDIRRDTFMYGGNTLFNIVVTKTGTVYPNTFLIVDGHYDTYNGPGANDNGSGVAIVMEVARLLKDIETEYSVKFVYFSAEEEGLIGSSYYVSNTVIPEEMDILLVFNIDEVGGVNGESNTIITCERDEGPPTSNNAMSSAYTDTLANCVEVYSDLSTFIYYAYGSDYMPFEEAGEIITGLYEYNESPYPHSINDSISNLDMEYVFQIAKASAGASLYFSKAYKQEDTMMVVGFHKFEESQLFPNPAKDFVNVKLIEKSNDIVQVRMYNVSGQEVVNEKFYNEARLKKIDISTLRKGVYVVKISFGDKMITKKLIKT